MCNLLITAIIATLFFGLAILAMAVGLMLRGRVMRGGCGSNHSTDPKAITCEMCSKKKLNLCDDEDKAGLAGPSFASTMGRFSEK